MATTKKVARSQPQAVVEANTPVLRYCEAVGFCEKLTDAIDLIIDLSGKRSAIDINADTLKALRGLRYMESILRHDIAEVEARGAT